MCLLPSFLFPRPDGVFPRDRSMGSSRAPSRAAFRRSTRDPTGASLNKASASHGSPSRPARPSARLLYFDTYHVDGGVSQGRRVAPRPSLVLDASRGIVSRRRRSPSVNAKGISRLLKSPGCDADVSARGCLAGRYSVLPEPRRGHRPHWCRRAEGLHGRSDR